MKLKSKLLLSFFLILLTPVMLATIAFFSFHQIRSEQIETAYGLETDDYSYLTNTSRVMGRSTNREYLQVKQMAEESPEQLLDHQYLSELNQTLANKNSYVQLQVGDETLYCGGTKLASSLLPDYGDAPKDDSVGMYIDGVEPLLLKQIDFTGTDGESCSLFIITDLGKLSPDLKAMLYDMGVSILIILAFTAGIMVMWLYGSLIAPLQKLTLAANSIKEGNLDFSIEEASNDEIGDLCRSFEDMRKRLKENTKELMDNEKENRMLISNISHDLKTPLTAIQGYVEGIIDGVADSPEKMDRYIKTIHSKANEMTHLVNELTLYSKIDTNRIPYNFDKINISSFFQDYVEELSLDLTEKNIGLHYSNFASNDIIVIADNEQLGRVMNNMISNTIKYLGKENGMIHIRLKDVGDFIQVEIEDNGCGIDIKDLPYIFDRFYRTDASRNSATGGSGIGLSIVKKIIEDHGGKIWATSKVGAGTVMYFVLRKYQEVNHA